MPRGLGRGTRGRAGEAPGAAGPARIPRTSVGAAAPTGELTVGHVFRVGELDFDGDSDVMSSGSSRWDAGTDDHLMDREARADPRREFSDGRPYRR